MCRPGSRLEEDHTALGLVVHRDPVEVETGRQALS